MTEVVTLGSDVIVSIESAVREDRVTALATALAQLNSAAAFNNSNFFLPPSDERYVRKLLWADPAARFVIVAMTWAPGQGTALHDHAGLWGAEIVVDGAMNERSHPLIELDDARGARFGEAIDIVLEQRSVGILLPPLEYHAYRNATESVAHTVHVYSGLLESCNSYTRQDGGDWWRAQHRTLTYDA